MVLDPTLTTGFLTLELTSDARIRAIKHAVFGIDQVTDVVSLRYDPIPGDPDPQIGELFVNAQQAFTRAPQRKDWSPDHELALYIAHSLDHLAGQDDATDAQRRTMRRRDLRWTREAHARALVRGLFSDFRA